MRIDRATVLLTGAGGGLGRYIARALATRGARFVLADRPGAEPDDLARELGAAGTSAVTMGADLSQRGGSAELVRAATEAAGPPDILVNNAGLEFVGAYTTHTEEELESVLRVNLAAPMELIRLLLPGMLERGRGHVVNMSSLAGHVATAYTSTYSTTKHGLLGLTQALRAEYAKAPVGFSAVSPGFVSGTGMYARHEDTVKAPAALGTVPPERVGKAVVRAIERDRPEVLVVSRPVRPLIALGAVAPGVAGRLSRMAGVDEVWRQVAERHGRL
jgi:short-subunit dehydrogenase